MISIPLMWVVRDSLSLSIQDRRAASYNGHVNVVSIVTCCHQWSPRVPTPLMHVSDDRCILFTDIVHTGWEDSTDDSILQWTCWCGLCTDWGSCRCSLPEQGMVYCQSVKKLCVDSVLLWLPIHRMAAQHFFCHHWKVILMWSVYWLMLMHGSISRLR